MTYASEIAQQALQRARAQQLQPARPLGKSELARWLAEAYTPGVTPTLYAPQQAQVRRQQRRKASLRDLEFSRVLADGAALLAVGLTKTEGKNDHDPS